MDLPEVYLDQPAIRHHGPAGAEVTLRGVRDRIEPVGEIEIERELPLTWPVRRGPGRCTSQERRELRVLSGLRAELQHELVSAGPDAGHHQAGCDRRQGRGERAPHCRIVADGGWRRLRDVGQGIERPPDDAVHLCGICRVRT